ncbi:MAG: tyrosine-type recombinase/integrase [Nocardioidaceae bacterium]
MRKLASGRYSASYPDPSGQRRFAPRTFETRPEATDWLTVQESLIVRREWTDPDQGKVPFGGYALRWIDERPGLRPRTAYLYRWTYGRHLEPFFSEMLLSEIDPAMVRRWRKHLLEEGTSESMVAKGYRLLRAILNTAVEHDELIRRNPCRIAGAGTESPPERPILTTAQVFALADAMPDRFRAMIFLSTFASLRYGEVIALERRDLDLGNGTVRVRQTFIEVAGKGMVLGPPKSRAGLRTIALPKVLVKALRRHCDEYVDPDPESLVFTGPKGATVRRGDFNWLVGWSEAVSAAGVANLHFHDLRHTGNVLAAGAGVSTRDLMTRMGHDSMHAALIYQHATTRADRLIAAALDAEVRRATKRKNRRTRPRSERSDSAPNGNHDEAISEPGSLADRPSGRPE